MHFYIIAVNECTRVYQYTRVCMFTHTHTHTHTHTYTNAHIHNYIRAQAHIIFNVAKCKRLFGINSAFAAALMTFLLWLFCTCTQTTARIIT